MHLHGLLITELYPGRFNSLALISFYLAFEFKVTAAVPSETNTVRSRLPDGWVPSTVLPEISGELSR